MLPRISSEGMGVAPPANEFSVATSAGKLLYGTIRAHLSRVPVQAARRISRVNINGSGPAGIGGARAR